VKVTIDLDDATVWSLLEASGKESLEEALEVAIASYIHLSLPAEDGDETP